MKTTEQRSGARARRGGTSGIAYHHNTQDVSLALKARRAGVNLQDMDMDSFAKWYYLMKTTGRPVVCRGSV